MENTEESGMIAMVKKVKIQEKEETEKSLEKWTEKVMHDQSGRGRKCVVMRAECG